MDVTCPSCTARFHVDDELIGPAGRKLRCGRCSHVWHFEPPAEGPGAADDAVADDAAADEATATSEEPPPEAAEDVPPPPPEVVAAPRRRPPPTPEPASSGRRGGLILGWLIFLVVLGGLGAGGWLFRDKVVAQVPGTAKVYAQIDAWLGDDSAARVLDLELRDVVTVVQPEGDQTVLVIRGRVVNTGESPRAVPKLTAAIIGPDGQEMSRWEFTADASELAPGAATSFKTETDDPPKKGGRLSVELVPDSQAMQ